MFKYVYMHRCRAFSTQCKQYSCDNKGLFYAILFYSSVNPFLLHIHYVVWFVFLSKRCAQSTNLQSLTIKHNCLSSKKIVSEMQASLCNATFRFTFTTYKTCFSTDWEEEKKYQWLH